MPPPPVPPGSGPDWAAVFAKLAGAVEKLAASGVGIGRAVGARLGAGAKFGLGRAKKWGAPKVKAGLAKLGKGRSWFRSKFSPAPAPGVPGAAPLPPGGGSPAPPGRGPAPVPPGSGGGPVPVPPLPPGGGSPGRGPSPVPPGPGPGRGPVPASPSPAPSPGLGRFFRYLGGAAKRAMPGVWSSIGGKIAGAKASAAKWRGVGRGLGAAGRAAKGAGFAKLGGGVSKLGAVVGKAGPIAAVVTAFVTEGIKFGKAIHGMTQETLKAQERLAQFSGQMASVFAEKHIRDVLRDIDQGGRQAPSARELVRADANVKDELAKMETLATILKNKALAPIEQLLADMLKPIGDLAQMVSEWIDGKPELDGFNALFKRIADDAEAAKARGDAGFKRPDFDHFRP